MSKAGLFTGLVTEEAPAEDALTSNPDGFHWFEIGEGASPVTPIDPLTVPSLYSWIDGTNVGGSYNTLFDKSGNGNYWTAPVWSTDMPTFSGGEAYFNGTTTQIHPNNNLAVWTQGEILIRHRLVADPPASDLQGGFMYMGNSGLIDTYVRASSRQVLCSFGSTTRRTVGTIPEDLTQTHCMNIWSATNNWGMRTHNADRFIDAVNTPAFISVMKYGISSNSAWFINSYMTDILLFTEPLDNDTRDGLNLWLDLNQP